MNKSEIRTSAEEFLREARELIADEQIFLLPRKENTQWIEELDITVEQAYKEIARLTINNYCSGPEEDRDRSGTFLWIFGGTIEKQETYIKLKIEEHPRRASTRKNLEVHFISLGPTLTQISSSSHISNSRINNAISTLFLLRKVR